MIFVGLFGKSEDYDLQTARRLGVLLAHLGYVELYLADPKDWA